MAELQLMIHCMTVDSTLPSHWSVTPPTAFIPNLMISFWRKVNNTVKRKVTFWCSPVYSSTMYADMTTAFWNVSAHKHEPLVFLLISFDMDN